MSVAAAVSTGGVTLVVALIAATASIVAAALTAVFGRRTQLISTRLQNQLAEQRSEADAWRSYRFSALTRLYEVYEPLRFQLTHASAQATGRIIRLLMSNTSTATGQESPRYRLRSTIYNVLAPSALFRLMEHRLTLIDLRLDARLNAEYFLIRSVCISFTADALVAALVPSLPYTPYVDVNEWRDKRAANPGAFRRQGLPLGRLDNSLDALITTAHGVQRMATFGEFEERLRQIRDDDVSSGLGAARDLLDGFQPSKRPVLTRILVVQLLLYGALLRGLPDEEPDYPSLLTDLLDAIATLDDLFALHDAALVTVGPSIPWPTGELGLEQQTVRDALEPALRFVREQIVPEAQRRAAPAGG